MTNVQDFLASLFSITLGFSVAAELSKGAPSKRTLFTAKFLDPTLNISFDALKCTVLRNCLMLQRRGEGIQVAKF